MRGNSWTALVALGLVAGLAGCAGAPRRDAGDARQELASRGQQKGWVDLTEAKTPLERRRMLERAVGTSRSAISPAWHRARAAERAANKTEPKPEPRSREQDKPEATGDFSFEFRDAELGDVVFLVAGELGLNVMIPLELKEPVTASFPAVDARKGLIAILDRYGYALVPQDGVFVVEKKGEEPLLVETLPIQSGIAIDVEKQIAPLISDRAQAWTEPGNRALVVSGTPEDVAAVREYLGVLDRRRPQVMIEALVVEVVRGNGFRWGADVAITDIDVGDDVVGDVLSGFVPDPPAGGANPFTIGAVAASAGIDVLLSADASVEKVNVLHAPFSATVSGETAILKVIESIPYIQASTEISGGAGQTGVTSTAQVEFEEAGVTLEVTPIVGGDDVIDVLVKPKVEELVGFVQGVPVIDTREATNRILVRNQETIVIAGLLRDSRRYQENKVPILGDIPVLGELFRSEEVQDEKVELMIFVTPYVMGYGLEEQQGFQAQDHYLDRGKAFPGVREEIRDRHR